MMAADDRIMFWGEDILDPYGGAFKVSRGLSKRFGERVLTTPISEAAIVGIAAGRAMRGLPTVVEIMFGDFVTLCADQIVNHATKLPWVYNNQVQVPLVIRTPMGGYRGYGATHSQSLEKMFCGVPGLTVLAVNSYTDPGALLREAFALETPVLFVEQKILYARFVDALPVAPEKPDVALVCYGTMVEFSVQAAHRLSQEEEVYCKVVPVQQIWPLDEVSLVRELQSAESVLVIEEGSNGYGFGGECARLLARLGKPMGFVAASPHPIPNSRVYEDRALPSVDRIVEKAIQLFEQT